VSASRLATTVAHPPGRSSVRWRILGLIFAASFVGYLLRSNMSVVGERMMTDLHLSQLQFGAVLAAFAWGYALFQVPAGLWGDRIGGRAALALAVLAWGVLTCLPERYRRQQTRPGWRWARCSYCAS